MFQMKQIIADGKDFRDIWEGQSACKKEVRARVRAKKRKSERNVC